MHSIKVIVATLPHVLPKFLSQTSQWSFKLGLLQSFAGNTGDTHSMILINLGHVYPFAVATPEDMYHNIKHPLCSK